MNDQLIKSKDIKFVPISEIKPWPKNRNKHPKEQIDRIVKLIEYQGFRNPLVISKQSGFLVAGHGRLLAAKQMKLEKVPCIFQDFESEEQAYAYMVSDNAVASWAELDLSQINVDIQDLGPDFDIDLLGIKDFTIDVAEKGLIDDDEIPEIKESFVKFGDIYQLGQHRLICGDSTDLATVERLMDGEKADLFLTDPPYGVGYADRQEMMNEWGKRTGLRGGNKSITKQIENDHGTIDECGKIWLSSYSNALINSNEKSSFYIFSPQGGDLMMMMMMMIDKSGWNLKHMLIWKKNNHVLGRCDYHYKHEPIFYGWNKSHDFYGDRSCVSILEFDRELKNDLHPTMKPVVLLEYLITNSSKKEDQILDLFGGSGSTLIACEKTNRRCFMAEIDPHYCAIIIERWQQFTSKKAELLGNNVKVT